MKVTMSFWIPAVVLSTLQCVFAANGKGTYGAYGSNFFAESSSTYYAGYEQAWRYLGWYVKCGDPSDRYDEGGSHENSHENSHDSGENRWTGNNWCQRYLIWAAYVDENYQGGGVGEYAHYDPYGKEWDTSACDVHGNGRCAPMDCHMNNSTTWTLMGVFKEASYFGNDAFFEQLFKHEGVCVWNDDELYEFMSDARENSWPQGCVSTGVKMSNAYYTESSSSYNDYIYIDLKPTYNGNMTYGLYTDSTCKYEYELTETNVETIAKSMGLLYGDYLEMWNEGLEIYKVCQPCKAYNLKNDYYQGNYYGEYGDDEDPNEGYFECYDDAGYTNVNQCMKFRTHAELEVATWEDLVTATNQGGILQVNISGTIFGSERMTASDYKYLQSMRRAEVQKSVKAQGQIRYETAQIEAMRPSARSWQGLGGLFLFSGITAMVGALLLLRTHHIKRTNQILTQPLILSKRNSTGSTSSSRGGLVVPKQGNRSALVFPHHVSTDTTAQKGTSKAPKAATSKKKPSLVLEETSEPVDTKQGGSVKGSKTSKQGSSVKGPKKPSSAVGAKQGSVEGSKKSTTPSEQRQESVSSQAATPSVPVKQPSAAKVAKGSSTPVDPKRGASSGVAAQSSVLVGGGLAEVKKESLPPSGPPNAIPKTRRPSTEVSSVSSKSQKSDDDVLTSGSSTSRMKALGTRLTKLKKKALNKDDGKAKKATKQSAANQEPEPKSNQAERPGALKMTPDGSPFFLSQSILSNEDLFVDPKTVTEGRTPTGAIEMGPDGTPFFLTRPYMSPDKDVMTRTRSDVKKPDSDVDSGKKRKDSDKNEKVAQLCPDAEDVVMRARSFDD